MASRRHVLASACLALAITSVVAALSACTGPLPGNESANPFTTSAGVAVGPPAPLTGPDVMAIIGSGAHAVSNTPLAISVVDRAGNVLGVYARPPPVAGTVTAIEETSVSLARTGAYFSNDTAPLSSELVRFLSREHFPEIAKNTPAADLFGIENTNRGCDLTGLGCTPPGAACIAAFNPGQFIAPALNILQTATGPGVTTHPGGFPLFRNGLLIGGVGVAGAGDRVNEFASLSASTAFALPAASPSEVFLFGIHLPYLAGYGNGDRPGGTSPGTFLTGEGGLRIDVPAIGGAMVRSSPIATPPYAPEGFLIGPMAGSPGGLTLAQVNKIVQDAVTQASRTIAAIRLPLDSRAHMVIAVAEGIGGGGVTKGQLLALFRMPDATVFSIDVAATKSRNVIYFSSTTRSPADLPGVTPGIAVTSRTIGFGAQSMYPSGIDGSGPGPFRSLFENDVVTPCSQGSDTGGTFPANEKSGIVFFPGASPLYKNGVLVGGLGVSGDGVNQDDVVTEFAARPYQATPDRRADTVILRNVRLPYFKFSRNPDNGL